MTLGLVITAYNETLKPGRIEQALEIAKDPRINEVVISDDCSVLAQDLQRRVDEFQAAHSLNKIRLIHQPVNLGVFGNKLAAIRAATTEWVQSLDSDNQLTADYLKRLFMLISSPDHMLCPSYARPEFDYREQAGQYVHRNSFAGFLDWKPFGCLMNTGNQCFHRETMLRVMEGVPVERYDRWAHDYLTGEQISDLDHRRIYDSADSFCFNKYWILSGRSLRIADGLEYLHNVHELSSWKAAPPLKEVIPPIYMRELLDAKDGIYGRKYRYMRYRKWSGGTAIELLVGVPRDKECTTIDVLTGRTVTAAATYVPPRPPQRKRPRGR